MDGSRFDALLHALALTPSRRGALRLLIGFPAGGFFTRDALPIGARKKKKVALCHEGQTIFVSKKAKKKHLKHGDSAGACASSPPPPSPPAPPTSPPPAGGCPNGQKPCDGGCIPREACCDNGDCQVSGQLCTAAGLCDCPPALPDECGQACLQKCPKETQTRTPGCVCCIRNTFSSGSSSECCSGRLDGNGACLGKDPGTACTFPDECRFGNCVQGKCSSCVTSWDYCNHFSDTCGAGGECLKAIDGTTRCGTRGNADPIECGRCTSDDACDQGQGLGRFCAVDTGPNCHCGTGQTFCASPR